MWLDIRIKLEPLWALIGSQGVIEGTGILAIHCLTPLIA